MKIRGSPVFLSYSKFKKHEQYVNHCINVDSMKAILIAHRVYQILHLLSLKFKNLLKF